nr:hypothetical protein Iba_chr10bCG11100 [Ipomoea batatas]
MTSENNCIIEYVDNACVEMSSDEIGVKKHNNFCDEPYDDSFDHNCVDAYIENVIGNVDCVVDNVHANPLENVGDINTKRDDDICDNSSNACKNATYELHDNALKCRNDFWDNVSTLFDNDEIVECNEFELLDLVDNNVLIDSVDNVNACVEYAVGKDRSEGVEIESRKEEVEDKKKTRDESVMEEVEEKPTPPLLHQSTLSISDDSRRRLSSALSISSPPSLRPQPTAISSPFPLPIDLKPQPTPPTFSCRRPSSVEASATLLPLELPHSPPPPP